MCFFFPSFFFFFPIHGGKGKCEYGASLISTSAISSLLFAKEEIMPTEIMLNGECSWVSISVKELGTERRLPAYGDKNKRPVSSSHKKKNTVAGKDWGQEEKGTTEDEMVGWYHRLIGHGFEQAPGR